MCHVGGAAGSVNRVSAGNARPTNALSEAVHNLWQHPTNTSENPMSGGWTPQIYGMLLKCHIPLKGASFQMRVEN